MRELHLGITLQCGQSFRWRECQPGRWTGMIKDMVWTLTQDDNILYCFLHNYTQNRTVAIAPVQNLSSSVVKLEPDNESGRICHEDLKPPTRRQCCSLLQDNSVQSFVEKKESSGSGPSRKRIKKQQMVVNATTDKKLQNSSILIHSNLVKDLPNTHTTHEVPQEKRCMGNLPFSYMKVDSPAVEDPEISATIVNYYTGIIRNYFRLDLNLEELYREWSDKDSNFSSVAPLFPGIRMLDQPPIENVFSFICSSNNNIVRISQLVEKLCVHFGEAVCDVDGTSWHSFPSIEQLCCKDVEGQLRNLGFGYRASYISRSAERIAALGGEEWLRSLRLLPHEECRQQLRTLAGVGPKVSDCICLMSMNHLSAVPVDTHVFQIAARDYLPELRGVKTVTNKVYKKIADHFRQLYGERAGWAHSVLFSADLKKFADQKKAVE